MENRNKIIKSRRYDLGISGDELSLKISSYAVSAQYLASRLSDKSKTICELCCGIGVSLVTLSKYFERVIGVDNDGRILDSCKTNLRSANVDCYELILGDVASPEILSKIKTDIVLYDIPYWSNHKGKINAAEQNPNLGKIVSNIRKFVTENVVVYTPPSYSYDDMTAIVGECEYQQVFINGKHDRNFVFCGDLINQVGITRISLTH